MTRQPGHSALVVAALLTGCGSSSASPSDAGQADVAPPPPSRLVSVGTYGPILYDADGYPTSIPGEVMVFAPAWNHGLLVSATVTFTDCGVQFERSATFKYVDGRIATMDVPKAPAATAQLEYLSAGSLSRWTNGTAQRTYGYDGLGRLQTIDTAPIGALGTGPFHDELQYDPDACPTQATESGVAFTYSSAQGKLTAYSDFGPTQYAVSYDTEGRIESFLGTGPAFQPLAYEPGGGHGVDLFPTTLNGGAGYGFPAYGEIFLADGRCDPTLSSQAVIVRLLLRSILEAPQT